MSDSWDDFRRKYDDNINSLKSILTITIYGSYFPKGAKVLLLSLKQSLINEGYEKTVIVKDRQEPDSDPLEISKKCLLFSDVNFLVFTKAGKRHGVIRELAFVAEDDRMRSKISHCVVFEEVKDSSSSIPPLSISDIKNSRIPRRPFRTIIELKEGIVNEAYWHLRRLSSVLSARR